MFASYPGFELSDKSIHFPCSDPTFSFDIAPIEQVNDEDYFPETQIEIL
eukprot:SAG31_NODE_36387_length_314_cov_0.493023_1_plen_48_part_01